MTIKDTIKKELNQILKEKYQLKDINFQIEYPPDSQMGDYSSNIAMMLAKKLKKDPLKTGSEIVKTLNTLKSLKKIFDKIEIVKPCFINFYLSEKKLLDKVKEILKKKGKFGQSKPDKKLKIQVEFISANPTGPLHIGNGRGGFTGDVLSNILELAGHKVIKEFYINNWGNQIRKLGHSVLKDKEAVYKGKYINELSKRISAQGGPASGWKEKGTEKAGLKAAEIIVNEMIKKSVEEKMKIQYDTWFEEKKLHESGEVDKVINWLKKKDLVYKKEGAWWFRASKFGDDKDRVIIKSNGDKTYLAGDFTYHKNKFKRGFDKVINIWGADHHGDMARIKGAVEVLGYKGKLEIILVQLVRLIESGKEVRMSKRTGTYVTIDELIDEVGLDAARFFFLMHAANTHMNFDLKLAKEKSQKNPVYYVQYAHARICSILEKAQMLGAGFQTCALKKQEKELIKELIKWPELVSDVAQNYEVHKICFYTISLADKFHDFYENCKVIENNQVNQFRLELIKATQQVLQNSLKCLGVSAPERM